LAAPPKLLDRATARNCLLTNLLVLPGLGSVMAGRRRAGALQILTALSGFGLTSGWFTTFCAAWWRSESFPVDGGPYVSWGLLGVALFVAGWLWGFVTGLRLLRRQV
jgi:hypothetical protein